MKNRRFGIELLIIIVNVHEELGDDFFLIQDTITLQTRQSVTQKKLVIGWRKLHNNLISPLKVRWTFSKTCCYATTSFSVVFKKLQRARNELAANILICLFKTRPLHYRPFSPRPSVSRPFSRVILSPVLLSYIPIRLSAVLQQFIYCY